MVAEVVPESRRVEAGALLYTSAPMGLFLATWVNNLIAHGLMAAHPETSWRYVFACGLVPAGAAFVVRLFVKEPERWKAATTSRALPRVRELFTRDIRPLTLSGFLPAVVVLITWWSCNAFNPVVATQLAQETAKAHGLDKLATAALAEDWKKLATNCFNWGGLIGTLLTIPAAKLLGRRPMFAVYFVLSALALLSTFGLPLTPHTRLLMYFFIGLTVFGVFGSFTYYLPELFPTRLRATGAGFCYNIGRVIASAGPFLVSIVATRGVGNILHALFCIGFVPLLGLCFLPWIIETRGRPLAD